MKNVFFVKNHYSAYFLSLEIIRRKKNHTRGHILQSNFSLKTIQNFTQLDCRYCSRIDRQECRVLLFHLSKQFEESKQDNYERTR